MIENSWEKAAVFAYMRYKLKSGNTRQAKSLKSVIEKYKTVKRYMMFENGVRIYRDEFGVEHYPLFMMMWL